MKDDLIDFLKDKLSSSEFSPITPTRIYDTVFRFAREYRSDMIFYYLSLNIGNFSKDTIWSCIEPYCYSFSKDHEVQVREIVYRTLEDRLEKVKSEYNLPRNFIDNLRRSLNPQKIIDIIDDYSWSETVIVSYHYPEIPHTNFKLTFEVTIMPDGTISSIWRGIRNEASCFYPNDSNNSHLSLFLSNFISDLHKLYSH